MNLAVYYYHKDLLYNLLATMSLDLSLTDRTYFQQLYIVELIREWMALSSMDLFCDLSHDLSHKNYIKINNKKSWVW